MGQQPNMPLGFEDLPRPIPKTDPPRRWSPTRPGELSAPDQVPWGGAFGTPGPDAGYALKLLASRDLDLLEGESRHDAELAVAAVAAARASHFGRAPVAPDLEIAEAILGFGSDDPQWRRRWTSGLGHDRSALRSLVAAVDSSALFSTLDEVRARAEAGDQMVAG